MKLFKMDYHQDGLSVIRGCDTKDRNLEGQEQREKERLHSSWAG